MKNRELKDVVLSLLKPDTKAKKIILILFVISLIVSILAHMFLISGFFRILLILFFFLMAIIGLLRLLVNYTLSKFFDNDDDEFEVRFSKGFYIIFMAGIIAMFVEIIKNILDYYKYYLLRSNIDGYIEFTTFVTYGSLIITLILGIIGLYGALLLITSLKYYKRNGKNIPNEDDSSEEIIKEEI